jgi:hypothetical protein
VWLAEGVNFRLQRLLELGRVRRGVCKLIQRYHSQGDWVKTVGLPEAFEVVWVAGGQRLLQLRDPVAGVLTELRALIPGRNAQSLPFFRGNE